MDWMKKKGQARKRRGIGMRRRVKVSQGEEEGEA